MRRTCKKCGKTKSLEDFVKMSKCRHGRAHVCKECTYNRFKQWCKEQGESVYHKYKDNQQVYRVENRKKLREYQQVYRVENRKKLREYRQVYRGKNRDILNQRKRTYVAKNRKKLREYQQVYQGKNRDIINQRSREWNLKHPERTKASQKKQVDLLRDGYVKHQLKRIGIFNATPEHIEQKREQLKLTRLIYERQREINASGNH